MKSFECTYSDKVRVDYYSDFVSKEYFFDQLEYEFRSHDSIVGIQGVILFHNDEIVSAELHDFDGQVKGNVTIGIASPGMADKYNDTGQSRNARFEVRIPSSDMEFSRALYLTVKLAGGSSITVAGFHRSLTPNFTNIENISVVNYMGDHSLFIVKNKNDSIQGECHNNGVFYESSILQELQSIFPQNGVAVDVGANVGNHTVFMSKYFNSLQVIPFEASIEALELLRANVVLNSLKNVDLSLLGLCVSNSSDQLAQAHTSPPNNLGGTSFEVIKSGEINTICLNDALRGRKVDLIKVDVEGMEVDVLNGAKEVIEREQPVICIEVTEDTRKSCFVIMEELNYSVHKVFHMYKSIWTVVFISDHWTSK